MGHDKGSDATTASQRPPSAACELFASWNQGSATFPLPARGSLVVGRMDGADVRLPDASVSRKHAAIHLGLDMEVEDLGSANGTRVDGVDVGPGRRQPLVLGALLELGAVRLVVRPRDGESATNSPMTRVHEIVGSIMTPKLPPHE